MNGDIDKPERINKTLDKLQAAANNHGQDLYQNNNPQLIKQGMVQNLPTGRIRLV